MLIKELQKTFPQIKLGESSEAEISTIKRDNKSKLKNSCFIAIKGSVWDGHSFLNDACNQMASLIVYELDYKIPATYKGASLQVIDSRLALEKISSLFYGESFKSFTNFAITGTNGKTTTAFILEGLLNLLERNCAVIGTLNHRLKQKTWDTQLTSPGPIELHKRLSEFKEAGADSLVMEVSSHALDQHRSDSVCWDVCLFTNLSRDHLDYHKNMENYYQAKKLLFTTLGEKNDSTAVINIDDEYGQRLYNELSIEKVSISQNKADISFEIIHMDFSHTEFILKVKNENFKIHSPYVGLHNVYNLVMAITAIKAQSMDWKKSLKLINQLTQVPGRMEFLATKSNKNIFIDYSHTEDALEKALGFLKSINQDYRIICVFGAGGDRDKGKRPNMAKVSEKFSDLSIITSDNPRTEDPYEILKEIKKGFSTEYLKNNVIEIENREVAIKKAIELYTEKSVILIAGKGHENYQETMGQKIVFSDKECALKYANMK